MLYPVRFLRLSAALPVSCPRRHDRIDDSRACWRYKGVPRCLPLLFVSRARGSACVERLGWLLRSGCDLPLRPKAPQRAFGDARRPGLTAAAEIWEFHDDRRRWRPPFRDPHETDIDPRLARVFDDWHRGVQGVPPAPEGHRDLGPAGRGDAQHPGRGTPAQPARVSRSSPLVCLRDVIHLRPLERKL